MQFLRHMTSPAHAVDLKVKVLDVIPLSFVVTALVFLGVIPPPE